MPSVFATDSVQAWFYVCLEEKCDAHPDSDYLLYITENIQNLKSELAEFLETEQICTESPLIKAIYNSIDFYQVLEWLRGHFKDELEELNADDEPEVIDDKDAGIDKTDKMALPDFFKIMAQRDKACDATQVPL